MYPKKSYLPALNKVLSRYVDEVQDNLLIDTLSTFFDFHSLLNCRTVSVLRTLCNNQHGLFWAGDTAQVNSFSSGSTTSG